MAAETAGAFEAHQQAELERVTSLLKYSPSSLRLWRIPELKGFDGFASVTADKAEPGTYWTAEGLKVATATTAPRAQPRLRKYLCRVSHFRGSAQLGEARITGEVRLLSLFFCEFFVSLLSFPLVFWT
jgi:hypothetical protein